MRRDGFTLIETLIATSIALVLLGASVFASRAITENSLQVHERAQMAAIADEVIAQIRLDQLQNPSQPLSTLLGFGSGHQVTGGLYSSGAGSTVALTWGTASQLATVIASSSPVKQTGLASGSFTNIYAVAGDLADLKAGSQQVLDLTTPRQLGISVDADAATDRTHWTFYAVTTTVTQAADATAGWAFNNDAGSAVATDSANLKNGSYQVQVTVTNYHAPQSTLSRQANFSDWMN